MDHSRGHLASPKAVDSPVATAPPSVDPAGWQSPYCQLLPFPRPAPPPEDAPTQPPTT